MGNEPDIETKIATLMGIVTAMSRTEDAFVVAEFRRIFKDDEVKARMNEVMPYLYAGTLLSLTGREINEENLERILTVIGIKFDKSILELVYKSDVKSHIPYINAYYFLLASGRIGTEQEILSVIAALGLDPDKSRVQDVLSFLASPEI